MLEEDDSLFAATCAGAHGYILEGADTVEVLRTVRAGRRRGPVRARHRSPAHQVLPHTQGKGMTASPFPTLTGREREVLDLIAEGLDNQQIASRL